MGKTGRLTVLEQEECDEVKQRLPQIPTAFRRLPHLTTKGQHKARSLAASPFRRLGKSGLDHSRRAREDELATRRELLARPVLLNKEPGYRCENEHGAEHGDDDPVSLVELRRGGGPDSIGNSGGYAEEDEVASGAKDVDVVINLQSTSRINFGLGCVNRRRKRAFERSSMSSSAWASGLI